MQKHRSGFTLVELLVVVSVLALLAGMVTPVLTGVLMQAKIAGTRAQMGSLNVALDQYRESFHSYPPSNPSQVAACADGAVGVSHAASGAEALNFFLRGWYMDGSSVVRGNGYKVAELGSLTRTLQPMYTPEKDEQYSASSSRWGFGGAANGKFFSDKFDGNRPILYFKAASNAGTNPFTESHNGLPLAKWKTSSPKSFSSIVIPDGTTRSTTFMLWSAGPDERFMNDDDLIHP